MLSVIWSGASDASDVLLLIAALVAGLDAVMAAAISRAPQAVLLPAAVCLVALGLLAV